MQLRSQETPGPNHYKLEYKLPEGGSFSTAKPLSSLDQIINAKKDLPAPNSYNPKEIRVKRAAVISESNPKVNLIG